MYFTLSSVREVGELGDVAYFGEFYKLGKNLSLNLENNSKIKLFCYKIVFL